MGVLKNFDCSTLQRDQAIMDGATPYNVIHDGLSYGGHCLNKACVAFHKSVICNRGAGCHLINDDIVMGVVQCPCCRQPFDMENINLFRCTATVTIHSQQEETSEFHASGMEIVKIGKKLNHDAFQSFLMTVNVKQTSNRKECLIC